VSKSIGSLIHLLAPSATTFGWDMRAVQAIVAMSACALVAVRRRDVGAVWLCALAPALVRVVTDPVLGSYYWQPVEAAVIAGIALGAPISRSRWSWVALALIAYLPYMGSVSGLWLIVGAGCTVAWPCW
jgi:hypothetical protein